MADFDFTKWREGAVVFKGTHPGNLRVRLPKCIRQCQKCGQNGVLVEGGKLIHTANSGTPFDRTLVPVRWCAT